MSKDVFRVTYEVPADRPEVAGFNEAVAKALWTTQEFVDSVEGIGFYTASLRGYCTGVVFPDLVGRADCWRAYERVYAEGHSGAVLCVPKKTKAAKSIRLAFEALPNVPQSADLARALGWVNGAPSDGTKIYWATVKQLALPHPRVLLRLPRQIGDGWTPPDFFVERTEGDYMRAIEAHNAMLPS